ncbi:hypothetical protein D9758_009918 [Tetrapyrgos nigripes]|uniref:Uncharacterized protein n=1 Tax=Tetrapyrgos nigripes TaxID=182062 RepID=A0A8H5CQH7_9AGAR|nr:hypothetical protein D9758_009918 [Tetrapyrgos nigripes]
MSSPPSRSNSQGNNASRSLHGASGWSPQGLTSKLQLYISNLETTLLPGTVHVDSPPDLCELDSSLSNPGRLSGTQRRKYISRSPSSYTAVSTTSTTSSQFDSSSH